MLTSMRFKISVVIFFSQSCDTRVLFFVFHFEFYLKKLRNSMFSMFAKRYHQCLFFIRRLGAHEFDNKFILNKLKPGRRVILLQWFR